MPKPAQLSTGVRDFSHTIFSDPVGDYSQKLGKKLFDISALKAICFFDQGGAGYGMFRTGEDNKRNIHKLIHNWPKWLKSIKSYRMKGHDTQAVRQPSSFAKGADIIATMARQLRPTPGVYRMMNSKGDVLYVGKAKNLPRRLLNYTQRARLTLRIQRMVAQVTQLEIVETHTEVEALLLEANLIKKIMPPFNVVLKDDKSYPYLFLSSKHDYPGLYKYRGPRHDDGKYFGPFASAATAGETLEILQRAFLLRNCSDTMFDARTRPCLQYHIKRCSAPCVGKVSHDDYGRQVHLARRFLSGNHTEMQNELSAAMDKASGERDYEKAAQFRDQLRVLSKAQARQKITLSIVADIDVFAITQLAGKSCIQAFFYRAGQNYGARSYFPRHAPDENLDDILSAFLTQFYLQHDPPHDIITNIKPAEADLIAEMLAQKSGRKIHLAIPAAGEKKKLIDFALSNAVSSLERKISEQKNDAAILQEVAQIFQLPAPPARIEFYDNSHIQGAMAIGAMIVAGPDGFQKKSYRQFNIKHAQKNDDFAMMAEVFQRRFARDKSSNASFTQLPDVIFIDGGQGQLSKAAAALHDTGHTIPLIAMAKGPHRNAGDETFYTLSGPPVKLPKNTPALHYLQRLRDEVHRFAIGTHRARRVRAMRDNSLDALPGVGAIRKKALLHHFGSAMAVQGASVADLQNVPGISEKLAEKIYNFFHA